MHSLGVSYSYLAEGVGNVSEGGTFRALTWGYTHWASGRLDRLEVNCCHPDFYHVRYQVTPSMKSGVYHVYILFDQEPTVKLAQCECAPGYYDIDIILTLLLCTLPSFVGCRHHVHMYQLFRMHLLPCVRVLTLLVVHLMDLMMRHCQ